MNAAEYNEKVWASQEIVEARINIAHAALAINEDAKGWGMLTLENARQHLKIALAKVEALMLMAEAPIILASQEDIERAAQIARDNVSMTEKHGPYVKEKTDHGNS